MTMALRRAGTGDAAAIGALHIASWRATYRDELPDEFLRTLTLEEHSREWRERLESPGTHVLLLEDGSELRGFAASGPTRDSDAATEEVWELYNLHIAPDRQGGGLGGRLFASTLEVGRRAGRGTLSLWVVESNTPARRFYEKYGMRPDGATHLHQLGPAARLREVRYRRPL